ncbi:MAG: VOC family protein, partial [Chloroflexota bacterium]
SDHAVSEALYLTDPDGHGIEIYRDRPRAEWPYLGGTLQMGTEPFDVNGVLAELNGVSSSDWTSLDPKTMMGHVHLHIGHLQTALDFYTDVVGFDLVMRYGPSAGFVSAGGYHHHLGLNTWAGVGALPPAADTARLLWYEIVVGDETLSAELAEVAVTDLETRLKSAGVAVVRNSHFDKLSAGSSLQFQDLSANTIHVHAASF